MCVVVMKGTNRSIAMSGPCEPRWHYVIAHHISLVPRL